MKFYIRDALRASSTSLNFYFKWSEIEYAIRNATSQLYISLHNGGLFVHYSIIEWDIELGWNHSQF